jgi:hypothetical protein
VRTSIIIALIQRSLGATHEPFTSPLPIATKLHGRQIEAAICYRTGNTRYHAGAADGLADNIRKNG